MIRKLSLLVVKVRDASHFLLDEILAFFIKRSMGKCGKNVLIKPSTSVFKGLQNIHISDNVRIARYAVIYATEAKLFIGSKVGIAPYLKIMTGNHNTKCVGHFMFDGDFAKEPDNDKDVVIEGDNWIGINVTILSGVSIGRGSVIAAGSVVNKSCPPYSIIGGVPAKVLKYRFSVDEILEHEKKLYVEKDRLTREEIENSRKQNNHA